MTSIHRANHDPLTGLPNRDQFRSQLDDALARRRERPGRRRPLRRPRRLQARERQLRPRGGRRGAHRDRGTPARRHTSGRHRRPRRRRRVPPADGRPSGTARRGHDSRRAGGGARAPRAAASTLGQRRGARHPRKRRDQPVPVRCRRRADAAPARRRRHVPGEGRRARHSRVYRPGERDAQEQLELALRLRKTMPPTSWCSTTSPSSSSGPAS